MCVREKNKEVGRIMKKRISVALVITLAFALNAWAADFAGEALSIGVGARPLGMGGTFAAIADDASTSYWNAAGMVNVEGVEVSSVKLTSRSELETGYSYVNLVYNMNKNGALGIGWLRQAVKDIKLTDIFGNIVNDQADNADDVVYLAYAYPVAKGFAVGGTAKLLIGNYPALSGASLDEETSVSYLGYGLDLGVYVDVSAFAEGVNLSFGLNLQDLYTALNWSTEGTSSAGGTDQVDINIKPGVAYRLPVDDFEIILGSDIDLNLLDEGMQNIIHGGLEIWWNKMVAIRGGIKSWGGINYDDGSGTQTTAQEPDWSLGASIRWYFIGVDFAFVKNELSDLMYLSVIGKF